MKCPTRVRIVFLIETFQDPKRNTYQDKNQYNLREMVNQIITESNSENRAQKYKNC